MSNTKKIDYINIDGDTNYFDTREQIKLRNTHWFHDASSPSKKSVSSNSVVGLFSGRRVKKDRPTSTNLPTYKSSEVVTDASGNSRKILASNIDFFSASILDSYKNGVEITQEKHWTAGLVKITAGTPGHLYENSLFGVGEPVVSSNDYCELVSFDPVSYLRISETQDVVNFTIIENSDDSILSMNGTIEAFPIRSSVFGTSIEFPFEARGVRGEFGNGNVDLFRSCDQVLSVHEIEDLTNKRPVFYLDVVDALGLKTESGTVTVSASIGAPLSYISSDVRVTSPFEDSVPPRGNNFSSTYDDELKAVISRMSPRQTSYLSEKQFSAACGFVNESTLQGVESITFSNMSYNSNSSHRSLKKTLMRLRDSESFMQKDATFNDNNTIKFSDQVIEYPSMLPSSYVSSSAYMNDAVRSIAYRNGAINVSRTIKPGSFDQVLQDAIIEGKRRLGTL